VPAAQPITTRARSAIVLAGSEPGGRLDNSVLRLRTRPGLIDQYFGVDDPGGGDLGPAPAHEGY